MRKYCRYPGTARSIAAYHGQATTSAIVSAAAPATTSRTDSARVQSSQATMATPTRPTPVRPLPSTDRPSTTPATSVQAASVAVDAACRACQNAPMASVTSGTIARSCSGDSDTANGSSIVA